MEKTKNFVVKIKEGKEAQNDEPSVDPVYRNILSKDGFVPLPQGIESC